MNTLAQILLGIVITAIIGIFTAPYFIDWNQYKSEIEAQASKILGRQLMIAGNVNLRLVPAPYLQLEKITVRPNGGHADKPTLLEADSFKLWLSAPPLLRGVIDVQEIEIVKPHLHFALDENGTSNWYQKTPTNGNLALPFTPASVSLRSVKIRDGSVKITSKAYNNGRKDPRSLRITALNGNFSAGSIKGPYKFDGTIGKRKKKQVFRLSTSTIDDKASMRVKAVLRSSLSGHRTSFDGAVLDLEVQPTVNGVLSASFPFFKSAPTSSGPKAKSAARKSRIRPIELKTAINANTSGASFDKILVTIVHKNRPQVLTGKGRLTWNKGGLDLNGNLGARLIDIDHLRDGLKLGQSVGETITSLFTNLSLQAARIDSGRFDINIDQIKLNGDLIQNVRFNLEQKAKNSLSVKKIAARLPGDNMIEMHGIVADQTQDFLFKGRTIIRGQSLGHLVTWSAGSNTSRATSVVRSHPFTLRGDLLFGGNLWSLNHIHGDIASTSFTGEITYRGQQAHSGRGETVIKLATSEINSTALMGRPVALQELVNGLLAKNETKNTATEDSSSLLDLIKNNSLKLQLRAGRLRFEDFDGRDLVADVFYGLKRLQINELSLRSTKGLHLHANGSIDNLEQVPSGTLTGTINIEDEHELQQFASWFASSNKPIITQKQRKSLVPLRLAVMLQTAKNTGDEANIRVNGIAGSSHIRLNNRILGKDIFSRSSKRKISQMELSGTLKNKNGAILLTQIVPHLSVDPAQLQEVGDSKLWFSAAGLPDIGLKSRVEFNSNGLSAGLDGLLGWNRGKGHFKGSVRLSSKDMFSGLALLGVRSGVRKPSGSLALAASLTKMGERYEFSGINGTVSSSQIEGRATLHLGAEVKKMDLILLTSALYLPSLFSPLLENPRQQNADRTRQNMSAAEQFASSLTREVGAPPTSIKTIASSQHFVSEGLKNIEGKFFITADKLYLGEKIIVKKGDLSASISKQKLTLDNLAGALWGGKLSTTGTLDLSKPLAQIKGQLKVEKASLEQAPLHVQKRPLATGTLFIETDFEGKGLSPSGLLSLLKGKGNMRISEAKIKRLSPSVLTDIVDDELSVWKQSEDQTPFKERFRRHLHHGDLAMSELSQGFTINDGALMLKSTHHSKNHAKLDFDANLSLATLDAHLRVTVSALEGAKYTNLPATNILFAGPFDRLDTISPSLQTQSLEQHLKVMKLEHDVDILEKLHKRDEEFAQKAAERRAEYEARKAVEDAAAQADAEQARQTPLRKKRQGPPPSQSQSQSWNPFN